MIKSMTNLFYFIKKMFLFGIISLIGLSIDVSIYSILVYLTKIFPAYANMASASTAIIFVFFISNKFIFESKNNIKLKCTLYFLYQMISIITFSFAISFLIKFLCLNPLQGKAIIVGLSFLSNYLFLNLIQKMVDYYCKLI